MHAIIPMTSWDFCYRFLSCRGCCYRPTHRRCARSHRLRQPTNCVRWWVPADACAICRSINANRDVKLHAVWPIFARSLIADGICTPHRRSNVAASKLSNRASLESCRVATSGYNEMAGRPAGRTAGRSFAGQSPGFDGGSTWVVPT